MTDSNEFIDNFLEHAEYDPRKAREYYLRTRKLLGRKAAKENKRLPESDRDFDKDSRNEIKKSNRMKDANKNDREERLALQAERIRLLRLKMKNMPPDKKKKLAINLAGLEKKLNSLRDFKNPFSGAKLSRADPKPLKIGKPGNPFNAKESPPQLKRSGRAS